MKQKILKRNTGFTLVEIIVAVGLFAIVMVVATGAIFSIVNANKNAQSLNSVITNLNFAIESMSRDIRTGTNYDCDGETADPQPHDCATTGATKISFINSAGDNVQYKLSDDGAIEKNIYGQDDSSGNITAPEVHIDSMMFYVAGTGGVAGGSGIGAYTQQPHMLVRIKGYAGMNTNKSSFDIQTFVSQRSLNVK
jgi:prepilin-type N-terminal cleavage/methylation domain-containing protein